MKFNVYYLLAGLLVIGLAIGALFWIRSAQQRTGSHIVQEEELYLDRDLERAIETAEYEEYLEEGDAAFVLTCSEEFHGEQADGKMGYTGSFTVVNEQLVPLSGIIVLLEFTNNGDVERRSFTTDQKGVVEFDWSFEPGDWKVEVVDIPENGFYYEPELDHVPALGGTL